MRNALILTLLLAASAVGFLPADDKKEEPSIVVTGMTIHRPMPLKEADPSIYQPSGTNLELGCTLPGKYILGVDPKASKLAEFTDDKKTDLTKAPANSFPTEWLPTYGVQITKDGQQGIIRVNAPGTPAKGADRMVLKGSIAFLCGKDEKSEEKKDFELKKDATVTVAGFEVKVTNEGNANFGAQVMVSAVDKGLKGIEFLDADGKAIKMFPPSKSAIPDVKGTRYTTYYSLPPKTKTVTMKLTYFAELEKVTVPLDLKIGVGLE